MAVEKAVLNINFAKGIDTKTDKFQIPPGHFLYLQNSIFDDTGLLQKRNGFGKLTLLPNSNTTTIATFNGGLTAIGTTLLDYSSSSKTWVEKGQLQPINLTTLQVVRNATNQTQADAALSDSGLACVVFTDVNNTTTTYKYTVIDKTTGQVLIAPAAIPVSSGTITTAPRVFKLDKYFILVLSVDIAGVDHLQYVAINITNPSQISTSVDISAQYAPSSTLAFDGFVANNTLYLAWNGSDGGGAIRMAYLTSTLSLSAAVVFAGSVATHVSVTADITGVLPVIYTSFYDSVSQDGYTLSVDSQLNTIFTPVATISSEDVLNITSSAQDGVMNLYYEIDNTYSYNSNPTNYIKTNTVSNSGVVGTAETLVRSVGLASKAFLLDEKTYFLAAYDSDYQPTYFLINEDGQIVAKVAYSNGGGYLTTGLPQVSLDGNMATIPYLFKSLLAPINKEQGAAVSTGMYSQTGINLGTFEVLDSQTVTSEIAGGLHLTGGFLWMYDGTMPVEHGFMLWPDNVVATANAGSGSMTAQQYFYVAVYEWTDAAGNIHRSAPSIPTEVTLAPGDNEAVLDIPTLRLTYKIDNPIKIVIYRWSVAQQTYYQVTSITAPLLNDTTVDSVQYTDTLADSSILGNSILYTTGGVIENVAAPASSDISLFKSRLFLIDAENRNLMWFSKQVIQNTPVEMSDLFTVYVAPTTAAQGNTGPLQFSTPMDDKLILFKKNAIYYMVGTGPDNTGANNDFSEPVFITATVGSDNKFSVVMIPNGLMFQSDKGIWLLGRDMSTSYIGADVEEYTQRGDRVVSALAIPGTNQVRFSMDSGIVLMYDYYYQQWGVFNNIRAISGTLFDNLHTYVDNRGQIFQETPGRYLDGSNPVLLSFTTGWLNMAGLQGFERAYFIYLLASYFSPHKITVDIAYDYNPSPTQSSVITPDNYNGKYGSDSIYGGGSPYGGNPTLEQWRVFLRQQKCQSFQLSIKESFDSTQGVSPGAGFTMSGIAVVVGIKGGYPRLRAKRQVG